MQTEHSTELQYHFVFEIKLSFVTKTRFEINFSPKDKVTLCN